MVALYNIPFAILNNLIVLGCLWLVYQCIAAYLKITPQKLFVLAVGFQLIATCKFIWDVFVSSTPTTLFGAIQFIDFSFSLNQTNNLFILIGAAYCIACLILCINLVVQFLKLENLRSSADYSISNEWSQLIADIPSPAISKIKIGTSALVDSPIVFGYLEPIILLPISICTQLNSTQLKLVLVHELAHILRQDYLLNWFAEIAKTILWFNPFAYLMHAEMHLQRELACDEFVIKHTQEPITYSKALYALAKMNHLHQIQMSLGVMPTQNELLYRIKKINKLDDKARRSSILSQVVGMVFLLITITLLPFKKTTPTLQAKSQFVNLVRKASIIRNINGSELKTNMHYVANKKKQVYVKHHVSIPEQQETTADNKDLSYSLLLNDTKQWIKAHENPVQLVSYNSLNDSIENQIAERLLISAILKNYQLKKALLEKRIENATDANEAKDYILNSAEWADMEQYGKWVQSFLNRQQ